MGLFTCKPNPLQPQSPKYTWKNHAPEAQYIGKEKCAGCHADKFETFSASEMGRSFSPGIEAHSVANWKNIKPLYDPHLDLYYQPYSRGDSLYVREYRLSGNDTTHNRVEKVDWIVGSGQHTNSHIREENGYLYQVPLTWYAQDKKWDFPPGFENGHNIRFDRTIELECMTCHDAMPHYYSGSDNRFSMIPAGIDCERCHGPGSLHLDYQKNKKHNTQIGSLSPDSSIVNPSKLAIDIQFDVCQRCHLQGVAVPLPGKTFMDFRPGMRLNEVINVFLPRFEDSDQNFIMAAHPDRLRMSSCFIKSEAMSCISCHNPHLSIKTLGSDHYNQVCQDCHSKKPCASSLSLRNNNGDDCVDCHMPKTGSKDIPHVRITDHKISIPSAVVSKLKSVDPTEIEAQKAFVRLFCRTQDNPDALVMAGGFLAYYEQFNNEERFLDSARKFLEEAVVQFPIEKWLTTQVRYLFLAEKHQDLIALAVQPDTRAIADALTRARIAEAFLVQNRLEEAIDWFRAAILLAPDHLQYRTKLAGVLIRLKDPAKKEPALKEALILLEKVLNDNPKFVSALNNRGYARVLQGDYARAEPDFRKAISLDPDAELPLANLASLLFNSGRPDQAKPYAKHLIRINPNNAQYQMLWEALIQPSKP